VTVIGLSATTVGVLVLTSGAAYAYIDPGSASLILQGLVGAAAALLVALRLYWGRLKRLFSGARHAADRDACGDVEGGDSR